MKNLQTLLIILTAALFFTACQKEETPDLWNIRGTVEMTDNEFPEIKSPVENVKIHLFKAPIIIDSVTHWFDKEIILDSTQTDVNGTYSFLNLAHGDYIVMPVDTSKLYQFSWSDSPDSIWIESTDKRVDYEINFTTPEPVMDNDKMIYEYLFEYWEVNFANENWNSGIHKIVAFRTAKEKIGCGFLGLSSCDWYWDEVDNTYIGSESLYRFIHKKDASTALTEYKDEFHFKFYINRNWVYTLNLNADDINEDNYYRVVWENDRVWFRP